MTPEFEQRIRAFVRSHDHIPMSVMGKQNELRALLAEIDRLRALLGTTPDQKRVLLMTREFHDKAGGKHPVELWVRPLDLLTRLGWRAIGSKSGRTTICYGSITVQRAKPKEV